MRQIGVRHLGQTGRPKAPRRKTPEQRESAYTPEAFWLSEEMVYAYRERLFTSDENREKSGAKESDGVFLYSRSKEWDTTKKENGWRYFEQVSQWETYYQWVTALEGKIFEKHPEIAEKLKEYRNHIELWPGLWRANKFKNYIYAQFLRQRKKTKEEQWADADGEGIAENLYQELMQKWYTHYGLDVSWSVTERLSDEYNKKNPIKWTGVNDNWFTTNFFNEIHDKAYYMLGGSIGNFDDGDAVTLLQRLTSDNYRPMKWSPIVLSHFLAPAWEDAEEKQEALCRQYNTPEWKQFIFKWLEALGIPTNKLKFAVVYEEWKDGGPDRIKIGAEILEDITVEVGWWKSMTKKKWEHIRAISSRRYTQEQFKMLAKKAWCKIRETRNEWGVAVSHLEAAPKRITKKQKLTAMYSMLLIAALWWVKAANDRYHQMGLAQKQKEVFEEGFFWWTWIYNSLETVLNANERQLEEIIALIENRYSAALSEDAKSSLKTLFYSRSKKNKNYTGPISQSWWRWAQMWWAYDVHLYSPHYLERFVWEYKAVLLDLWVDPTPNAELLKHWGPLQNSYFYTWPKMEFTEVDQELPLYQGYLFSISEKWSMSYWSQKTWIKMIDWKPYIVIQPRDGEPYVLEQRPASLIGYERSPQKAIRNIIQQWEVTLLAEEVRHFLVESSYKPEDIIYTNGQKLLAEFLTDLYAQWYDFWYLQWWDDIGTHLERETVMRSFVYGYVLPQIGDRLEKWEDSGDRMELDRESIHRDMESRPSLAAMVDSVVSHASRYTAQPINGEIWEIWPLKSDILKWLLTGISWQRIKNDADMRVRIMKNAQIFAKHGIFVPSIYGAKWVDRVQGYAKYRSQQKGFICAWNDNNLRSDVGGRIYVMQDGTWIVLRIHTSMFGLGSSTLVGQKITYHERQQILNMYNQNNSQRVHPWAHGTTTVTRDPQMIVLEFEQRNKPFTTNAVEAMFRDYDDLNLRTQKWGKVSPRF